MSHDFIDFSYGFIDECANLINNIYDSDDYYRLAIKLCSEFVMPIINIKEYNGHVKSRYFGMYNYKT